MEKTSTSVVKWPMDNDIRSLSIRRSNGEASVGASVTKKEEKEHSP